MRGSLMQEIINKKLDSFKRKEGILAPIKIDKSIVWENEWIHATS